MIVSKKQIINALEQFRDLKIDKKDLATALSNFIPTQSLEGTIPLSGKHVIALLTAFKHKHINKEELLDWVNTIWFSEYFVYLTNESDSIASVMNELEELDEDDRMITDEDIVQYIRALEKNESFIKN